MSAVNRENSSLTNQGSTVLLHHPVASAHLEVQLRRCNSGERLSFSQKLTLKMYVLNSKQYFLYIHT